MTEVRVGSVLRDNEMAVDYTVEAFTDAGRTAVIENLRGSHRCKINVASIHTDGKPRRRGWSLVS